MIYSVEKTHNLKLTDREARVLYDFVEAHWEDMTQESKDLYPESAELFEKIHAALG